MAISDIRAGWVLHPLHGIILAFPVALFTSALISDITYLNSAVVQWSHFSAWLIAGALVFAAPVLVWALVLYIRLRAAPMRGRALAYFIILAVMWAAGFINALQHSKDGWASVGMMGLTLSILATILALAAGWIAYGAGRLRKDA